MGQCLYCSRTTMANMDTPEEKESLTLPVESSGKSQLSCTRQLSADSAVDSGHSSGDEARCGGGGGGCCLDGQGRSSHSSESSGKFSARDSIGSCGEGERPQAAPGRTEECAGDMPVFSEEGDDLDDNGVFTQSDDHGGDSLHPLQDVCLARKISRGSSRGSRGSSSSERGSFSSVTSVTAILKARLGRSSSLVPQRDQLEAEVLSTCSSAPPESSLRPHRTVSLRLPRSRRPPHESDTNLPTIYVDDSPQQSHPRKSSIRRALSLLSMNTLLRREADRASPHRKEQKPVQKILRQPRRRHNTVRGLSGLAIDRSNQCGGLACGGLACGGLQRAHTLYYPTATSLRHATAYRAKSAAI